MESRGLTPSNYIQRWYWNSAPTGKKKEWQTCEVITLGLENLLTTESINHRKYVKTRYDQVKPIPLTEQWLLDFGFEKNEKGSVSVQFSIGTNPLTNDWILELIWLKTLPDYNLEESCFYRNGFHKIKFVHQLQNLYSSLTGEYLTLNK